MFPNLHLLLEGIKKVHRQYRVVDGSGKRMRVAMNSERKLEVKDAIRGITRTKEEKDRLRNSRFMGLITPPGSRRLLRKKRQDKLHKKTSNEVSVSREEFKKKIRGK